MKLYWQGAFFLNQSLAHVNREICIRLINNESLSTNLLNIDDEYKYDKPNYNELKRFVSKKIERSDVTIRHQWPPNFLKPHSDNWIIMQPWEFGSIPWRWYILFKYMVDQVWVYSEYNKECYIKSGVPSEKIKVIPLGIDPKYFNLTVKPMEISTKKKLKFLFVGGTIYRKGIDLLLEAYTTEFTSEDDVTLIIKDHGKNSSYKDQTFHETIKKLQENHTNPEIIYMDDELDTEELASLYRACDCLVHPYRGEGFGLPIIEAMGCGLPTIVPNKGPATEFCTTETSFFVESYDKEIHTDRIGDMLTKGNPWLIEVNVDSLKDTLRYAYNNKKVLQKMGINSHDWIHQNFTWDHTVDICLTEIKGIQNSLDSKDVVGYINAEAIELFKQGLYKESIEILELGETLYKDDFDLKYNLAISYFYNNQFNDAINTLINLNKITNLESLELKSEINGLIGICYLKLKNYQQAINSFNESLEFNSHNTDTIEYYSTALCEILDNDIDLLNILKKYDRKIGNFIQSISNNLFSIIEKYFETDKGKAFKYCFALNLIDNEYLKNNIMLCELMIMTNDTNLVWAKLKNLLNSLDDIDEAHLKLKVYSLASEFYKKTKNYLLAESYIKKALALNPYEEEVMTKYENIKELSKNIKNKIGIDVEYIDEKRLPQDCSAFLKSYIKGSSNILEIKNIKAKSIFQSRWSEIEWGNLEIKSIGLESDIKEILELNKKYRYDSIVINISINKFSPEDLNILLKFILKASGENTYVVFILEDVKNIMNSNQLVQEYVCFDRLINIYSFFIKELFSSNETSQSFIVLQKQKMDVLWESPLLNGTGYADEQIDFLEAIKPYPLKIIVNRKENNKKTELYSKQTVNYINQLETNRMDMPIVHYQAAPANQFLYPKAPISIGRTMFETDRIPKDWVETLNQLSEVWVPSRFNADTFISSGVKEDKIHIVPGTINIKKYFKKPDEKISNTFTFLSVFEWSLRKGWDVLLKAYLQEFSYEDCTRLIIKTGKLDSPTMNILDDVEAIKKNVGKINLPIVEIIETYLTDEELFNLYCEADSFVLPSRGEGWGRPYMQSMIMGIPTIGTRWSGQLEFMNDENSYLIDVERLSVINNDTMPFHFQGHQWAEPSIDHLRKLMRYVYENKKDTIRKSLMAQRYIQENFAPEIVGEKVYNRLNHILLNYKL
ncbi:glycosyltransferase [Metabacillus litoralis]|uniref:glycosyltransferase n=1 Tax=Metabacillus litoralis TaxID=152268 RepID=UPI00203BA28F|nr:glycosyltransferase [Metabacillus litoralis]MCM3410147.1 glycosyltransferase [Metabacillus litoralis]